MTGLDFSSQHNNQTSDQASDQGSHQTQRQSRRISSRAAADFLINPASYRFLEPFLAEENTVAKAAKWLHSDPGSVLYRIKQMLALGLLVINREEQRKGRAIKYYLSSCEEFFVPFALTSIESLRELNSGFTRHFQQFFDTAYAKQLELADDLGVRIWRSPNSVGLGWSRDLVPYRLIERSQHFTDWPLRPEMPAIWNQHAILKLKPAHAKALQQDLAALWRKYSEMQDDDGQDHALRLALVVLQ
jgi:hypothetical protein